MNDSLVARPVFAAVDIGASSGRVVAGVVVDSAVTLETVHRFPNGTSLLDGHLRWNVSRIFEEVVTGLAELARRYRDVVSIGVDTWAIDYGLLDEAGSLVAEPISYRDGRTDASLLARVHSLIDQDELFAINGLQHLPFTTLYQLATEQLNASWTGSEGVVLIPDLLNYWLTGRRRSEVTNASTTGLFDATTRGWSRPIMEKVGLELLQFAPLVEPGTSLGPITSAVSEATGLSVGTTVIAVGSHDTASAVVGVPAKTENFAFVSSGTWSLVGVELDKPLLTDAARAANFTNEGGVDGKIRFLRNVGGLWLLQECVREWAKSGRIDLTDLLRQAASLPSDGPLIDVDDPAFIAPDDMPARIQRACLTSGQPAPRSRPAIVRCILDSLATVYAKTVDSAVELTGRAVEVVHIVGGGSQNELLCQLTADLTGLPVLAGPVEATALGNIIVQARAYGALRGDLPELRAVQAAQTRLQSYAPNPARRVDLEEAGTP